jgi:hypothetical protein
MDAAVHLVLRDADPNGIVTATRDNWTGKALSMPIADLGLMKEVISGAGVYVLVGVLDDGADTPVVYIGEAEEVIGRLTGRHVQLSRTEVTWQRVVVFVSQADDLHKAHIKWLESNLVELARSGGHVALANATTPSEPTLPRFDEVFAETFLVNMLVLYPLLGVRAFLPGVAIVRHSNNVSLVPSDELVLRKAGQIIAHGRCTSNGGVTLLAGSLIAVKEADYAGPIITRTRKHFSSQGWLDAHDADWQTLNTDYDCSSPSTAASVVMGRQMQGPQAWRTRDGVTLSDLLTNVRQSNAS